ncbi:MAG: heme lyase CcmF/NrfE family subunit [Pseudomonadota bacterium]
MPETLGTVFLNIALVVSFYGILASAIGGRTGRRDLITSSRNAVWGVSALVVGSSSLLVYAFLTDRYSLKYVYEYSNSTMPSFYKLAAFWGGQEGSILFWLLVLCGYASVAMVRMRTRKEELQPYIITTLLTIAAFFLVVLLFEASPFETMQYPVRDGRGLNPLLQNFYMIIHPPALYLGYVGMSIPFAYAVSALVTGKLDNRWVLAIRRWTLVAWFFLSVGNLLGALWAYEVLGWGGYWAWDPVENASFIPWLTATALLHSAIVQEKRGILKVWNMSLVVVSFVLTLFGTFLTRSGIVSSVHSFAKSNIGTYFLVFLGLSIAVSVGLILFRLKELKSRTALDSFLSRESAVLLNNLVLLGGAIAVLWGTMFPVFSELVHGSKITVGPPFFNAVMTPIGLLLLLLTGMGPMLAWQRSTPLQLRRNFLTPAGIAVAAAVLAWIFVSHQVYVILSFSLCAFVLATITLEYKRGIAFRIRTERENPVKAFMGLVGSDRRRYGGYVVHLGIVLLFVGFTGSAFKVDEEIELKSGERRDVGRYALQYDKLTSASDRHKDEVFANLAVWKSGQPAGTMRPSRVFFRGGADGEPPQPYTNVAIRRSLREDLYLALLSFDPDTRTAFVKVVVSPLVNFIWIGGLILVLGTVIVMLPARREHAVESTAKAAGSAP